MSDPTILGSAMKAGMRHLASGVAVVAMRGNDGARYAMTVTSITSVSDSPPSILVCLHKNSSTAKAITEKDLFSANVLHNGQQEISHRCAFTPGDQDRFVLGDWQDFGEAKTPYLSNALASFICQVDRCIDYGTHYIVIGEIIDVKLVEDAGEPLVYCRGKYVQIG